jgi:alpha-L-rhamnosidase
MWGMGILKPEDWQAQWIGDKPDYRAKLYVDYVKQHWDKAKTGFDNGIGDNPPLLPSPLLRKKFEVVKEIKNAFLYVSSLGDYEMGVNGERVGDHQLAPEWTDYFKRVQYQTYNLNGKIKKGWNTLSAVLADGWYLGELGPVRWQWANAFPLRGFYGLDRRLIARLQIEFIDGSTQTVVTDESWKINTDGYIVAADNFAGQTIDARKIIHGWDKPEYDDANWKHVYVDTSAVKNLEAQKNEPIRIHRELKPVEITKYKDRYIINFGQNIAGWCALKLKGKAGTVITLRHGEWINSDGSIYTEGLGYAKETDVFVLSGGDDFFEPRFTYHGFQYVEISGLETPPTADMIVAKAVSSDPAVTGKFECSNPKLNRLFDNILWTQRNNMHSVPTDCPQRDERCGWLGDAQVFSQTSIFNMNMAAFYTKFVKDMRDAIAPNGQFYSIVPSVRSADFGMDWYGGPAWADAGIIIPWRMYENYADVKILSEHYDAMKNYVESIHRENPNLLWQKHVSSYNDWLNANTFSDPPENYNTTRGQMPDDVFNTAFFANSARLLSKTASVLGNSRDAEKYGNLADRIAETFVKNFVDADGKITGNTQSAYAIALHFNLLPENIRAKAFEHLLECLEEYDYRMSTGLVTTQMLMKELVRYGRADLAYRLLESERFPSWIYAVNQGATTLWERWDAYVKGRGIHPSGMNSFDHYALGSVGEWIFSYVLGINYDINSPGYEHFTIHPRLGGKLTWAKGSYNSIRGEIASSWKIEENRFTLTVKIPANTTATIILPTNNTKNISSGNGKFKYVSNGNETSVKAGSGEYTFTVNL